MKRLECDGTKKRKEEVGGREKHVENERKMKNSSHLSPVKKRKRESEKITKTDEKTEKRKI